MTRHTRKGFTLIELLVVMVIILTLAVLALPVVIASYRDLGLKQGAQTVHSSLIATIDRANLSSEGSAGMRLLVDDPKTLVRNATGQIDPDQALKYSRLVPLYYPPRYTSGLVSSRDDLPATFTATLPTMFGSNKHPLILEEAVFDGKTISDSSGNILSPDGTKAEPTSWYWNIRVGDTLKIAGFSFTVCGPSVIGPGVGNSEWFVNVGPPSTPSSLVRTYTIQNNTQITTPVEYLYLVNNTDDDMDGSIDGGWDGMDNNLNGLIDEYLDNSTPGDFSDDITEWEPEVFRGQLYGNFIGRSYEVIRRPAPRMDGVIELPKGIVVDATNWSLNPQYHSESHWHDRYGDIHYQDGMGSQANPTGGDPGWDYAGIRSRLPVNVFTGETDIMFTNGGVSTISYYGIPPQRRLGEDHYHLWVAPLEDATYEVIAPFTATDGHSIPSVFRKPNRSAAIITINTRTGRILTGDADADGIQTEAAFLRQTR